MSERSEIDAEKLRAYFEADLKVYVVNVKGSFHDPQLLNDRYYYSVDVPSQSAPSLKWFLEQREYTYEGGDPSVMPATGGFTMLPAGSEVAFLITGRF